MILYGQVYMSEKEARILRYFNQIELSQGVCRTKIIDPSLDDSNLADRIRM